VRCDCTASHNTVADPTINLGPHIAHRPSGPPLSNFETAERSLSPRQKCRHTISGCSAADWTDYMRRTKRNPSVSPKEGRSLVGPITALALVLGALIALIAKFSELQDELNAHPTLSVIIIYLAINLTLANAKNIPWTHRDRLVYVKWSLFSVSTVILSVALSLIFWPRIEVLLLHRPAQRPEIHLPLNLIAPAYAGPASENALSLSSFYLNSRLSSYQSARRYRDSIPFFEPISPAFDLVDCNGPRGKSYIRNVLPILKEQFAARGLNGVSYLADDYEGYKKLITVHGKLFKEIFFTEGELEQLAATEPAKYEIVRDYLVNCVGVADPVLTFIVRNSGDVDIVLLDLVYHVSEVFDTLGSSSELLEPILTDNHSIPHAKGDFRRYLKSPIRLAPKADARFDVRLFSENNPGTHGWVLQISVEGDGGRAVTTEPFAILLTGATQ
jgi:hypothetical protein